MPYMHKFSITYLRNNIQIILRPIICIDIEKFKVHILSCTTARDLQMSMGNKDI